MKVPFIAPPGSRQEAEFSRENKQHIHTQGILTSHYTLFPPSSSSCSRSRCTCISTNCPSRFHAS